MRTLLQILTDQSGQAYWGGFLGGLNQAIQQANERKQKKEVLDIQKKKFDLEERESKFKMDQAASQLKSRL